MPCEKTDILVIGAGPAGLSAAVECAYHELGQVLVLEKGITHNQTVHQYYPDDKRVDAAYRGQEAVCAGVLCFRDTTKAHFLGTVDQLLQMYPVPVRYGTAVDSLRKVGDRFQVSTTTGSHFEARFVVIAIGRMGKPNRPDYFNAIPAAARTRVYFDLKGFDPKGKNILVVGGGNSAIEFALSLASKARVTVSYRGKDFFRLNPMNLDLLTQEESVGRIRILRESHVFSVGENQGNPLVRFGGGTEEVFDAIVYGIGGSSPAAFLQNAGMALDAKGNPVLSTDLESTVPGLFVAGELSVPPGKGSIIVSFNSGKRIAEAIATRLGRERKPEIVAMTS